MHTHTRAQTCVNELAGKRGKTVKGKEEKKSTLLNAMTVFAIDFYVRISGL